MNYIKHLTGFFEKVATDKTLNPTHVSLYMSLFQFWKRRWFRTLPNYYLILLVNFVLVRWNIIHGDILQFNWKFFVFLQNFSSPFYDFFWESWSLSVEEWFYVLTPIFLLFLLKIFPPKQSFMLVVSLMIIMPLLYRVYLFNPTIDDFWYDVSLRKLVVTRLDSIAFGLLSSWIFYYFKNPFIGVAKGKLCCPLPRE